MSMKKKLNKACVLTHGEILNQLMIDYRKSLREVSEETKINENHIDSVLLDRETLTMKETETLSKYFSVSMDVWVVSQPEKAEN